MIDPEKFRDEDEVSLREAAVILKVSESTVARYREEGKFPYIKYSRRKILYRVKDLREYKKKSYILPYEYLE